MENNPTSNNSLCIKLNNYNMGNAALELAKALEETNILIRRLMVKKLPKTHLTPKEYGQRLLNPKR